MARLGVHLSKTLPLTGQPLTASFRRVVMSLRTRAARDANDTQLPRKPVTWRSMLRHVSGVEPVLRLARMPLPAFYIGESWTFEPIASTKRSAAIAYAAWWHRWRRTALVAVQAMENARKRALRVSVWTGCSDE